MTAVLFWEIAAILQMLVGIGHFFGTIYSQLLHPKDEKLIAQMKSTMLHVDSKATQWNAWIFFNIAFSICLFLVGFCAFFTAYHHFEMVQGLSVFSLSMIICSLFIIYFAHQFTIRKVRTVFLVIAVLYAISIFLST